MLPRIQRAAEVRARALAHIDWFLLLSALAISFIGIATMRSFSVENAYFDKQIVWLALALGVFFIAGIPEYGFLRRMPIVVGMYGAIATLLVFVLLVGSVIKGAQTRFDLEFFSSAG